MKRSVAVLLLTVLVCAPALAGTSAKSISLFNGKDLEGWKLFCPDEKVDATTVWSVRDGVVHCAGMPFGYMRTEKSYKNYRLVVEWRWPDKPANSGVLLHAQEPDKVWPQCIEAQLQHTRAGDFVSMGETTQFNELPEHKGFFGGVRREGPSAEKPAGKWNRYEILCDGDTIELRVNGKLVNKATGSNLKKGHIAFQSEGGPIEFRKIELTPLSK